METLASQITSVDRLIFYVVGFLATAVIGLVVKILYDMWKQHQYDNDIHEKIKQIADDVNNIMKYTKDKGIDDFTWDCKYWHRRGYITPDSKAGLLRRYDDLEGLKANGDREVGKQIIDKLPIKEED